MKPNDLGLTKVYKKEVTKNVSKNKYQTQDKQNCVFESFAFIFESLKNSRDGENIVHFMTE